MVQTRATACELGHGSKLTLEFVEQPGYPKSAVTVVNAVVRDMKSLQTLAIA